jgi:hypothetical protein
MIPDLQTLIGKYRAKGILLDSNLLVLLFVGLASPDLIENFKRTKNQGFTANEFILLRNIVSAFSKVATTPHILTETSNYIFQLKGEARQLALGKISNLAQTFKERRVESKKLTQAESFPRFGLTDSAILDLSPKSYFVLSVDVELVIALQKKRIDAINFNNIRHYAWEAR